MQMQKNKISNPVRDKSLNGANRVNGVLADYHPNYFNKAPYCATPFRRLKSANFAVLSAIVYFLAILVSVFYFLEINNLSSLGYEIKAYQRSVASLEGENKKIKLNISQYASLKNIEDSSQIEKLNLVGISEYQYLSIPTSSFAKR